MSNEVPGYRDQVTQRFQEILETSPAYLELDPDTRRDLRESLATIAGVLSRTPDAEGLARSLAPPDLQQRLSRSGRGTSQTSPARQDGGQAGPAQGTSGQTSQGGATSRVGEVARATLDAIGFPDFVSSLITGTFQAIVDSSIRQMQAYAELLSSVAGTVDQFMRENISSGMARDYLAEQYGGLFSKELDGREPRLVLNRNAPSSDPLPSFFQDLGFETMSDLGEDDVEAVVVPAARRSLAEMRQQTLATMVLMGINRVVVDDGEINAKLQFHIDASEATKLKFDQTKTTTGNLAGRAGSSPFTANAILVNTTSLNAQSDVNVRADLTGQVKVRFRSDYFPLERFADSAAIQLINRHARVPAAPGQAGPPAQGAQAGQAAPAAQPQAGGGAADPWAPR